MKCRSRHGQALPLALLLLVPLIFFVGANAERLLTGTQKIENQKYADMMTLSVITERVRALNAIAAYNQGLRIAVERGYAVGIALLTLQACTMTIFASPFCATALTRLGAKAVPFFQKLSKLGQELAKEQDQIAEWAANRPRTIQNIFNLVHIGKVRLFLYPESSRLPIRRAGTTGFQEMGTGAEENDLANGEDLKKCNRYRYDTYEAFQGARNDGNVVVGKNDTLTVEYRNRETGLPKTIEPRTSFEVHEIAPSRYWPMSGSTAPFDFQNATLLKCQSLYDILSGFGFSGIVKIPPPYLLEKRFFEGDNRLALARVAKNGKNYIDPLLKKGLAGSLRRSDLWALSEAEIDGGDLSKMEFRAILSSLTSSEKIWETVEGDVPELLATGFDLPPSWEDYHEKLAH